MAKRTRPRRGSLAYSPRKRANELVPQIKKRNINLTKLLGFVGYKVGMISVMALNNTPNALTNNMKVAIPCTVVATPPLHVLGVRLYHREYLTNNPLTEFYAENLNKDLRRVICLPKSRRDPSKKFEELEKIKDEISEVRLLCHTNPRILKIKKAPDIVEIPIGGNVNDALNFAKEKLGKEINIREVFQELSYVAITGVTKGKGLKGPVKRWGVVVRNRKATAMRRHVVINPETPRHTSWRAPQPGQVGFWTRTELNKFILKISNENITPKGGFKNFGILNTDYVLIKGSVSGTEKRILGFSFMPLERERKLKEKYEILKVLN